MRFPVATVLAMTSIVAGIVAAPNFAAADSIGWTDQCNGNCNWSVQINGAQVLTGTYDIDPVTGELRLTPGQPLTFNGADGSSVSINTLSGNIDPVLSFGLGASTGASGNTFSFSFSMPISLSGTIQANSKVSYTLTGSTASGAQIAPLSGHVVTAQEVDTTPGGLPALNKGVDVGNTFFFLGGPDTQNSPVYSAANMFTGNAAYDLMSVNVSFSLSAHSSVGVSGFVQQEPAAVVPLPAALPLLFSGLGWLGFAARRKKAV